MDIQEYDAVFYLNVTCKIVYSLKVPVGLFLTFLTEIELEVFLICDKIQMEFLVMMFLQPLLFIN